MKIRKFSYFGDIIRNSHYELIYLIPKRKSKGKENQKDDAYYGSENLNNGLEKHRPIYLWQQSIK